MGAASSFPSIRCDATGRAASTPRRDWSNQTLAANRLADVYEGYFTAGSTYQLKVIRNSGTADLAIQCVRRYAGGIYKRAEAILFSTSVNDAQDEAVITSTHTGWYPSSCSATTATASNVEANYTFSWTPMATAGVPLPEMTLASRALVPNPAQG
jgi:hypothetical protein